jgi:hypothetical protein
MPRARAKLERPTVGKSHIVLRARILSKRVCQPNGKFAQSTVCRRGLLKFCGISYAPHSIANSHCFIISRKGARVFCGFATSRWITLIQRLVYCNRPYLAVCYFPEDISLDCKNAFPKLCAKALLRFIFFMALFYFNTFVYKNRELSERYWEFFSELARFFVPQTSPNAWGLDFRSPRNRSSTDSFVRWTLATLSE